MILFICDRLRENSPLRAHNDISLQAFLVYVTRNKNSDVNFFLPNWYVSPNFANTYSKFERLEALVKGRVGCRKTPKILFHSKNQSVFHTGGGGGGALGYPPQTSDHPPPPPPPTSDLPPPNSFLYTNFNRIIHQLQSNAPIFFIHFRSLTGHVLYIQHMTSSCFIYLSAK